MLFRFVTEDATKMLRKVIVAKVMDQAGLRLVPLETDEANEQPVPGIGLVNVSAKIDSAVEALYTTLTFESATVQLRSRCPVRVLGKFLETQQVHVRLFPPLTLAFDTADVAVVVDGGAVLPLR